jgi:hypothetical protein
LLTLSSFMEKASLKETIANIITFFIIKGHLQKRSQKIIRITVFA